nr:MAG TPA: transcriptional prepressor [Caudoviricetes sp.]
MEEKKIRPQDKWNAKAGLISKSYKLKRELVEQFAEACETAGVSQAAQLTKMMKNFIDETNQKEG